MESSPIYSGWNKKRRYFLCFVLLALLILLLLGVNICAGSVTIPLPDVIKVLAGEGREETAGNIIWQIRFPRALAAIVLGGGLALSGYLLQTFFHNPIAGPFVLGISSGAKLTVALIMVFFLRNSIRIDSLGLILAAFAGSMVSMGLVLLISRKVKQMSMLIIGGVMVGYICSAMTDFIVTFAEDSDIINLHNWSMGSFSGISWKDVSVMATVTMLTSAVVFLISKPIGAYQLGEAYALNLGVNIRVFRVMLVLLSSILSACVTAFAGPVSFVGIAVPQLAKNMFRTSKPVIMVPACFMGGAVFCLFSDLLARSLFAPTELSISTVTAVFGAPVVIFVMINKHKQHLE